MKILIFNQHTANHGDEAAGKALIRTLIKTYPNAEITIKYNSFTKNENDFFFNECKEQVTNEFTKFYNFGKTGTIRFKINFHLSKLFKLPTLIRKLIWRILRPIIDINCYADLIKIKNYDLIISAPSGPNIGNVYKDYNYLWRIYSAINLNKKVAIYSPSIGKIEDQTHFTQIARYCLKNVAFLSIRDTISFSNIENIEGIQFVKSIDTAFLDNKEIQQLPCELNYLLEKPYIVFVPNELYKWHPSFSKFNTVFKDDLDELYISILKSFAENRIIMLPQLFGGDNDVKYFSSLCNKHKMNLDIRIIDTIYDSDVQQSIIKNAQFVIGARYHSIVFAIKNRVPFFSLSYEHKMSGLLKLLDLEHLEYQLSNKIEPNVSNLISRAYSERHDSLEKIYIAEKRAKEIATMTFNEFSTKITNG